MKQHKKDFIKREPNELDTIEFLASIEGNMVSTLLEINDKERALKYLRNYDEYIQRFLDLEEKRFKELQNEVE